MGREEQIEEREVLDSIFPDEITDLSETSFRVSIALDIPGQDEETEKPTILLTVTYPPSYPDTPPSLLLSPYPHSPKTPYLSLPTDTPHLLSTLSAPIAESLGQAMIFTLITTLKDSAEALIATRVEEEEVERDRERKEAEEEENRKFMGEKVTRESFLRWREGVRGEEREEIRRREEEEGGKRGREREGEAKLTGKMLWERGLVGRVDDEEEGEEQGEGMDTLGGMEKFKVAE